MSQKLVLASSSPFRRQILERLGLNFSCFSPDIDESRKPGEDADSLVRRLAEQKARTVARRFPDALIIGSDQVADLDGEIVGKPRDHADAVRQLQRASGRTTVLHTGVALFNAVTGRVQVEVDHFEVDFKQLDRQRIEHYLRREEPYQCCGSLRAEGPGICLLAGLRGSDPNTLIGLPVIKLCSMLENEGFDLLDDQVSVAIDGTRQS